jgi:hypothetical protein
LDDLEGAILLYGLASKIDPLDSTVAGNCHAARAKEAERRGNWAEAAHLYRTAVDAWRGLRSGSSPELGASPPPRHPSEGPPPPPPPPPVSSLAADDPDVVECLSRAVELEQWAHDAEAQRLAGRDDHELDGGEEVRRPSSVAPGVSFSEGARVDDVLSKQRSKNSKAGSSSAHAILSKVFSSVFKGRVRGATKEDDHPALDPSSEAAFGAFNVDPSTSRSRDRAGDFAEQHALRGPSRSPPPLQEPPSDRSRGSPSSPLSPSPLFGARRPFSALAAGTTLAPASPEGDLAALALGDRSVARAYGGARGREEGGGSEEEEEELGGVDFAGAGLLDEHAAASEALALPRRLVTLANGLVANRKYSAALTHYYEALEVIVY